MPKMSDATLARLIRPTGSACVGHILRSCRIHLLCPKCRMRRWRVLSDLRGAHVLVTYCVHVASTYCAQNVGCDAGASYPTYGERMCWSHTAFMSHPPTVPKMSDATLARLIRPTGSACVGHILRSCRIHLLCPKCRMRRWRVLSDLRGAHVLVTYCVHVASTYCAQNVGCDAGASYPTYGERMCWSHTAFMSHPPTVPKMSDATLARLIRPTGSACVGHILRSCRIHLLCPKCRMRRWRVLSDLRGAHVLVTYCVHVASTYCAQNVGCDAGASYPTYGDACVGRIRRLRRIRQWCPNATRFIRSGLHPLTNAPQQ